MTLDGGRRDVESAGGLLDGEVAEIAEFDNPGLQRLEVFEAVERSVQGEDSFVGDLPSWHGIPFFFQGQRGLA